MDPTPIEVPQRRRNRSLAALVLAVCFGLSGFFLTGDGGIGIVTALVVAALFAAMFLLAPRLVDSKRPLSSYYLLGLSIVVGPLVLLAVGNQWTPWFDLERSYPATGPVPAGLDGGTEVVLVLPVDEVMVRPYRFRRARVAFADDGVHLALGWPMSLVYDPLWIPLGAIEQCGESGLDQMYTSLAVAGTAARIEVVDAGDPLLGWCRERGIGDGLDHTPGLFR